MKKTMKPNYENSTINMMSSILNKYGVKTNYKTIASLDDIINKADKIVLFIFDGLGNNILNNASANGVFNKNKLSEITSVFPSTTVAGINTISSGLSPIEHGWLGWTLYFSEVDRTIEVFRNRYVGHKEDVTLDYYKILKYENIFSKIKRDDINCNYFRPNTIPNDMEDAKNYAYKTLKKGLKTLYNEVLNSDKKSFTYFYYDDPDKTLHIRGTKSFIVKHKIKRIERLVNKYYAKAKENIVFIISADHGLTDIDGYIYLRDDKDIYKMLKRRTSIETRATSVLVKNKYKEEFKEIFLKKYGDKFEVLTKEEAINNNLFGLGKAHDKVDSFIGDYIVIAKDKWCLHYSTEHKNKFKASHAGMTEDEMIIPLIVMNKTKK